MASPKDPVGVTSIPIEGQDVVPVYKDENGLKTFASDAPYITEDGQALQAPMPVLDVGVPIWHDANGDPVMAVAVTELPTGDGPVNPFVPHLQDFWSNDDGMTEFTTQFNITGPNIVLEMFFLYEGDPFFTITHGADTLTIAKSAFNSEKQMGTLIATSASVKAEISTLTVSATGGTFGGIFGRIRELDYPPKVVWTDSVVGNDTLVHDLVSPEEGELVGTAMWTAAYTDSGRFSNLDIKARTDILYGTEIAYTTSPVQEPWVESSPGVYDIDTPNRPNPRTLFDFTFNEDAPSPIYWDFAATTNPGSVTYTGIGNTTRNNNWTSGQLIGANVTQEQSRYNQFYTGATVNGYGNTRVGNFKFYHSVTPYHCAIQRSAGLTETTFRCSYRTPWVALVACLKDARDEGAPIPEFSLGPSDIVIEENHLSEMGGEFELASPSMTLGVICYYDGILPADGIQATHGGEPLTLARLDRGNGVFTAIFYGNNLTLEKAELRVSTVDGAAIMGPALMRMRDDSGFTDGIAVNWADGQTTAAATTKTFYPQSKHGGMVLTAFGVNSWREGADIVPSGNLPVITTGLRSRVLSGDFAPMDTSSWSSAAWADSGGGDFTLDSGEDQSIEFDVDLQPDTRYGLVFDYTAEAARMSVFYVRPNGFYVNMVAGQGADRRWYLPIPASPAGYAKLRFMTTGPAELKNIRLISNPYGIYGAMNLAQGPMITASWNYLGRGVAGVPSALSTFSINNAA